MKRSFGGGRMGGRGMIRTAIRSGVGGIQDTLSKSISSTNTNKPTSPILSLSSSSSSSASTSLNLPVSETSPTVSNWASCASSYFCDGDEWEWESVNGYEDQDRANMVSDNYVFRAVPSQDEVEDAVSSLKQVVAPALYSRFCEDRSSSFDKDVTDHTTDPARSELDWIEPTLHLYNPRLSQSHQNGRVYDAFHLLQTEPSIQRMVISLSSDKAIWDAVLNNEVVKELKESFCIAEDASSQRSGGSPDRAASILKWLLNNTKAKVLKLIENLRKLMNEAFRPPQNGKNTSATTDLFDNRVRTSLLLSIVVLLIVVVTRAHRV
ncbi:uncharacterized protein LOC122665975 [Telopea speciosissima]|uniref:uncharacterized protein LOC122665975 n=1 Tax=Telopea speciosissima TaxID=54955 RepID=UPI001CC44272|nr:uncharacterized protein LOC122665975 [Telopea speciosissima]